MFKKFSTSTTNSIYERAKFLRILGICTCQFCFFEKMSDTSFDNADNAMKMHLPNKVNHHGDNPSVNESKEVLQKIHEAIKAVKAIQKSVKITELKRLRTDNRISFYNCVCQVIAVLVPKEQLVDQPNMTYIRVSDGTTFEGEKMNFRIAQESVDTANSRIDVHMNQLLWSSSVDICCYDEFSGKARTLNPGDIVRVSNFRVKVSDVVLFFDLNGAGMAPPHIARLKGLDLLLKGDWNLRELVRVIAHSIEDSEESVYDSNSCSYAESHVESPTTVHNSIERVLEGISKFKVQYGPMSSALRFQDVRVANVQSFFDNLCQVVGILVPQDNPYGIVYLRVSDGTFWQGDVKKFELSADVVLKDDSSKLDRNVNDLLEKASSGLAVFDIAFYDEHAKEALTLMPGDIVKLTNLRVKSFGPLGAITMNGGGERFHRGIKLLGRAAFKKDAGFQVEQLNLPIADSIDEPAQILRKSGGES